MKNDQPSVAERAWRESVREQGCLFGKPGEVQIHHVVGRTAKHERVEIGHWWILPVSEAGHRMAEAMTKGEQKELFLEVCIRHIRRYGKLPVPPDAVAAIWDWHR